MRVRLHAVNCMRLVAAVAVSVALCSLVATVHAGIRSRGKYSGVVIFDRWDTCFLLSGPYITYISEAVKEELRPYAGQAIQLDVSEIMQPANPGDGLVKSYVIVGQAPEDPSDPISDRIEIEAKPVFNEKSGPIFDITVRNLSLGRVPVSPSEVGLTLLGINRGIFSSASDGKSVAWITRADLEPLKPDQAATASWSWTMGGKTVYARFNAVQPCGFRSRIELAAYDSVSCRIRFDVPIGEYQFMVGYGGGVHAWKSLVSNAISFNVNASGVAAVEP